MITKDKDDLNLERYINEIDELIDSDPYTSLQILRGLFRTVRKKDGPFQSQIVYYMAKALYFQSEYHKVKKLLDGWLTKYADNSIWRPRILNIYAVTLQVTGYLSDSFATLNSALKIATHLEDNFLLERIYHNMVQVLNELGAFQEAQKYYSKLEPFLNGVPREQSRINTTYCWTLFQLGNQQKAFEYLDFSYDFYTQEKDNRRLGYVWDLRGEIYLQLHDYDTAVECLLKGKRLFEQFGDAKDLCRSNRHLGAAYTAMGQLELAIDAYQEGIYSASVSRLPLLIEDMYFSLGNCFASLGDDENALLAFRNHGKQVEIRNKLKSYQQVQLLDLLIERNEVLKDHTEAIQHQDRLNFLQQETLAESSRLMEITNKFTLLQHLALALAHSSGYRSILEKTMENLSDLITFSKAILGEWDAVEGCYVFHELTKEGHQEDFFEVWDTQLDHLQNSIKKHYGVNQILMTSIDSLDGENPYIFCVLSQKWNEFDQYDEGLFFAVCSLAIGALQLSRKVVKIDEQRAIHNQLLMATRLRHEELMKYSYHDELTGLFNRSGLSYCLEQWLNSSSFPQVIVAVVLDLDHFKEFNDRYGHLAGDQLLASFGKMIQGILMEPNYLIARFGGEEFILLASSRYSRDINVECNTLLKEVQEIKIPSASDSRVTVSIGICEGEVVDLKGFYTLIDKADQQLYRAKKQGRNQICRSTGEVYANNR